MSTIQFPSSFKDVVISYNDRNFDNALKLLENIPNDKETQIFKLKLYASIYFLTKKWSKSLFYHQKILSIEPGTLEIFNNIAVTLFNLGKIKESINYFKKSIEKNNKIELTHQNLGISYLHIGEYQNAIGSFLEALNINNKNLSCNILIIDILNYIIPKNIRSNKLLKLNDKILNFFSNIKIKDIFKEKVIIKIIDEIKENLKNENNNIIYNKTEIFRRNSHNLNCKRHFKIFNKFNVIPEYCFGCYKVQINIKNVNELIKLLFLFNSIFLKNDNIRKCMVETRNNVKGNYKGFIYCTGLDEAKKVLETIKVKMNEFKICFKNVEIKHGCTEYYEKYPKFKKINFNGNQEMNYDKSWKQFEKIIDGETPDNEERVFKQSINKINLSDILIIKNWLNYAEIIGDNSFKGLYKMKTNTDFLNKRLENQINFRKKEL